MVSFVTSLKCVECGKEYSPSTPVHECQECGGWPEVQYDYDGIASKVSMRDIERRKPGILDRWIEFLPIEDRSKVESATLGQTATPLVDCPRLAKWVGVKQLYVKNDSAFPTGSFKDRSMPMAVVKALELGVKTITIVSSGNAAASLAAHGARAGLETIVFVNAEAPPAKLAQASIYGARVMLMKADYSEIMKPFLEARKKFGWYDCNAECNPSRFEGNKTCAYEIFEQLGCRIPDMIVSPMGSCSGVAGQWKAFGELSRLGFIDRLPRLAGIQAEASCSVVKAFKQKRSTVEPIVPGHTIASALVMGDPPFGKRALQAIYQSKGAAEAVSESEILEAVKVLAREGFFFEPAGATPLAGARKLASQGKIDKEETLVCVGTGHGLKMPEIAVHTMTKPLVIEATLEAIEAALRT